MAGANYDCHCVLVQSLMSMWEEQYWLHGGVIGGYQENEAQVLLMGGVHELERSEISPQIESSHHRQAEGGHQGK
jgi:hypothetical protein